MEQRTRTTRRAATAHIARARILSIPLVGAMALVLGRAADGDDDRHAARVADAADVLIEEALAGAGPGVGYGGEEEDLEFETLKFFIEFNETDEDVGVQLVLGGEPYEILKGYAPNGQGILDLRPKRSLKLQGMSDFFFESAEPSLDEFSMAEFLERFPEGEYEFESTTIEGEHQDGEGILTHAIPAGPVITSPLEMETVDPDDLTVTWEAVTMTTAFNPPQVPVTIVGYQVIVTREDPLRIYSADVSAETTSVSVPPEFLDAGTVYELEILAIEASDNQTISLLFFQTE